jgi:hypothetical protein
VREFIGRIQWVSIAAFVVPALVLTWLDRRAGRRR